MCSLCSVHTGSVAFGSWTSNNNSLVSLRDLSLGNCLMYEICLTLTILKFLCCKSERRILSLLMLNHGVIPCILDLKCNEGALMRRSLVHRWMLLLRMGSHWMMTMTGSIERLFHLCSYSIQAKPYSRFIPWGSASNLLAVVYWFLSVLKHSQVIRVGCVF